MRRHDVSFMEYEKLFNGFPYDSLSWETLAFEGPGWWEQKKQMGTYLHNTRGAGYATLFPA